MLKVGALLLSLWSGINLLLASFILVLIVIFGEQAQMLYAVLLSDELSTHDAKILLATRSLVILFNASLAAASLMALFIIWSGLIHGKRWAFWALLLSLGLVQLFGFTADSAIVFRMVFLHSILTALYVSGTGLARYAIYSEGTK
jgi:hypothetical protein